MSNKVSIILPSIRPANLKRWYDAASLACCEHDWEVIIVSPYPLPESLNKKSNIKYLRSFHSPTVASQLGTLLCGGEFLYNCVDDGLLLPGALDLAINTWNKRNLTDKDILNMRYREGVLDVKTLEPLKTMSQELPIDYWRAHHHAALRLPSIKSEWHISLHFFMKTQTYNIYGGYDCQFEYSSFAIHDLIFRLQADGANIINLDKEAMWCSHLPGESGDHFAVHQAQEYHDWPIFKQIYSNSIDNRIKLDYNNWKKHDSIWKKRFSK